MRRPAFALLVPILLTTSGLGLAQDRSTSPKATLLKAGRLIDARAGRVLTDRVILVVG
jgi:hypothetical protein